MVPILKWKDRCLEAESKLRDTKDLLAVAEDSRESHRQKYEEAKRDVDALRASKKELERKIEQLNEQIENMQEELDILNGHFKLDVAYDEETRLQIKRDLRVHQLEMENMELRRNVKLLEQRVAEMLKTATEYTNLLYSRNVLSQINQACQSPIARGPFYW